jgi:hypothetical protein
MSENLTMKLLEMANDTMISHLKKGSSGLELDVVFNAITETEEYLFLRFYHPRLDTDQYIIDFIRFISGYTKSPELIVRIFQIFIENIRKAAVVLKTPSVRFMASGAIEDLVTGFMVSHDE